MYRTILSFTMLTLFIGCGKETSQEISKKISPPVDDQRTVTTYLGDFSINLRDPQSLRILQMSVAVESNPATARKVEERKAKLRDAILIYTSEFTAPMVSGFQGKMNLKDDLHMRINKVLEEKVDDVYFTKFMVAQ